MAHLTNQSCRDFAAELASKASVPGGGGAAAFTGALGVALCSMVGNFTVGKPKYAAVEGKIQKMLDQAEYLRQRFLDLVELDAEAFAPLAKAYAIPKDDPARGKVLEEATLAACQTPVEMVRLSAQAIDLLEEMAEKGSRMLLSDAGCGALLCLSAMESAAINVFVNTATIQDREAAIQMEAEVDTLLGIYRPRVERLAGSVRQAIRR